MKIINFIKTLLPSLEKADIVEDLRIAMNELDNIVIPSYKSAEDFFNFNKPNSDEFKELQNTFYKALDPHGITKQKTFIKDISIRLVNVRQNAELVNEELSKIVESEITNDNINSIKALLLRTAGDISFISSYSSDLLNYIYMVEEKTKSSNVVDLPKATIKNIKMKFKQFVFLLSDIGMPSKEFEKVLVKVPDVKLNAESSNIVKSMFSSKDVDPFENSHMTNFTYNPIYHVRLAIAEWQTNRYKSAKSKKKVLELRLLHLKNMKENSDDPKLEKEIEYNQSRLDKLNKYLQDFQEEIS